MKLTLVKERIQKGSALASKVVSTKSNLPILANLKLTAREDNVLQIEASDLELSISLQIPAKVEDTGEITVPARKFTEYLGSINAETLTIFEDGNQLTVETDRSTASFITMPVTDFPEIPVADTSRSVFLVETPTFKDMVKHVSFAAATGDAHPVLSGVLFRPVDSGDVDVVATDSFRLSKMTIPIEGDLQQDLIIPAVALREIDAIMGESLIHDESPTSISVGISEDGNQVFFQVGEVEVVSRLLDAEFPNYEKIMPGESNTTATFTTKQLVDVIRSTAIFASREAQAIKLTFNVESNQLDLSARSSELGMVDGSIIGEIEGDDITVGFNARYILDALGSFKGDTVTIGMGSTTAATMFTTSEEPAYTHIVMPMSLNE